MTPKRLSEIGQLLFGPSWRGALAAAVSVAERTMRRWADGERDMPDSLPGDLANLCDERAVKLMKAAKQLRGAPSDMT